MATRALGRRILVPVANPSSVPPLLRHAAQLAAPDAGAIELVTVLSPTCGSDERARAWSGLADVEGIAAELGVVARTSVIESDDVAAGVLHAIAQVDASLVVIGWRGRSSTTDVFGRLIDHLVGRSAVPLAVVRLGVAPVRRVLVPVSPDHLLPGGEGGLELAVDIATRLQAASAEPATVLRTGRRDDALPATVGTLGDRIHHDPRRTHQAVGALAQPDDLIVAAVAPTASGLRAATTHLAWAAPDATLLVAIDVGPRASGGASMAAGTTRRLIDAVDSPGSPPPQQASAGGQADRVRIVVTARLPDDQPTTPDELDRTLRSVGSTDHLMVWWPAADPRLHVRTTVTLEAAGINAAIAALTAAVRHADALAGAEITYDVERGDVELAADTVALRDGDVEVLEDAASEDARRRR